MGILKNISACSIFSILLLGLIHIPLQADIGLQLDYTSKYIWRGFDLNPPGKPALQPSMDLSFKENAIFFNIWGSFSFEDRELNEIDITAGINIHPTSYLELQMGVIHYGWYFEKNFDFNKDTTHELFASLELTNVLINPKVTLFYDFHNGDGIYLLAEASPSVNINKHLTADLNASIGYNAGQWLEPGVAHGFSDANLGLSIGIDLGKFRVLPFVNYTFVLMDIISTENFLYYGISIAYNL